MDRSTRPSLDSTTTRMLICGRVYPSHDHVDVDLLDEGINTYSSCCDIQGLRWEKKLRWTSPLATTIAITIPHHLAELLRL